MFCVVIQAWRLETLEGRKENNLETVTHMFRINLPIVWRTEHHAMFSTTQVGDVNKRQEIIN